MFKAVLQPQFRSSIGLAVLLVAMGCGEPADPNKLVGQVGQDFQVETLQSKSLTATLAQYKGKPVILDFWATWCGPCRMITPSIEGIYKDYKSKGLTAMAITDEDRVTVQKFEANSPHQFPVYLDPNDVAHNEYKATALPTVVIIDRAGNIIYHEQGVPNSGVSTVDQAMRNAVETAVKGA